MSGNGNRVVSTSITKKYTLLPLSSASLSTKVQLFLVLSVLLSVASLSSADSNEDNAGESTQASSLQDSSKSPSNPSSSRVKRSREMQQFCGYRLLDALRTTCDRNFVGLTRRSDPNLLMQSGEGQSGEDFGSAAPFRGTFSGLNLSPWEILSFELPPSPVANQNGDYPALSNLGPLGTDDLELLQPQGNYNAIDPDGKNFGVGWNKAFALKMLAEPPKTHRRLRRNIIDECCKKPCAAHQMLKYCAIAAVGKRSSN